MKTKKELLGEFEKLEFENIEVKDDKNTNCWNCLNCGSCGSCRNCFNCLNCLNCILCKGLKDKVKGYWVLNIKVSKKEYEAVKLEIEE